MSEDQGWLSAKRSADFDLSSSNKRQKVQGTPNFYWSVKCYIFEDPITKNEFGMDVINATTFSIWVGFTTFFWKKMNFIFFFFFVVIFKLHLLEVLKLCLKNDAFYIVDNQSIHHVSIVVPKPFFFQFKYFLRIKKQTTNKQSKPFYSLIYCS